MPDEIGTYEVRDAAGTRVRVWPLSPRTTVAGATTPHPVAPGGTANPIVVGTFGIMDIVVALPTGAPVARTPVAATGLTTSITGAGTLAPTLFANADLANICFAVQTAGAATAFAGSLRVQTRANGTAMRLDIPVEVQPNSEENDLFIAFALTTHRDYTWIRMRATNHSGGAAIANATARIRALRDNGTVQAFNRECPARTTAAGFLAHDATRDVVGVPIGWPIVFEFTEATFVDRNHMLEFAAAQRTGHHNNNPHAPADVTMIELARASLATRRFALDPGHGVVYAATSQRRSQEWFLAHRIAAGVDERLRNRHGVPAANITWMRTAGLGLIEPGDVNVQNGPERGDGRYAYDMTARTIRVVTHALSLTDLSNLLLTTHAVAAPFAANAVPDADRDVVLTSSAATINAAVARQVATLAGRTVVANSVRWDAASQRYVFDSDPAPIQTHNLRIATTDAFVVTTAMLRNLAERTARWSLNREVAGGAAFKTAARNAMIAQAALAYMANAVFAEADKAAGHPFLARGLKGWSFGDRRDELRGLANAPDITLTLHHNAVPNDGTAARGNVMLASNAASATAAHMRLQKTFVKYVTGLEEGLRSRGITNTHASALNGAANAALIPGYAFFENEFMNASSPVPGLAFEYERMVLPAFIDRTVEEIVAGIVEFLLAPQPDADFDPVDIGVGINAGGVRW